MLENNDGNATSTSGLQTVESAPTRGGPHNKLGRNQYKDRPPRDDPQVAELLRTYHLKGINDKKQLSKILLDDHGITLSASSIARRKRELNLRAARLTTRQLSTHEKRQLILDQMAKDPAGKYGPRMVKQRIFEDTGIHLTRDYIRAEMKILDPVGSSTRGPAHVKEKRQRRLEEQTQGGIHFMEPANGFPVDGRMDDDAEFSDDDSEADLGIPNDVAVTYPEYPEEPVPLPPPSVGQILPPAPPNVTSPEVYPILHALQNIVPHMRSLTRDINSIEGIQSLSQQEHASLLDGMESAALLERALSRLVSKARPH